jgi:uncharacterized protein (DUF58 family)
MKRRLTKRAFIVVLVAGLLFLAGTTAQASWLFVIAAGVLAVVVGSLFSRHHLGDATIERTAPRRARVGDDLRVGLKIGNAGRRSLPLMRLDDRFDAVDGSAVLVEGSKPGQGSHIELVKTAHRRGVFEGGEATLTSGAPFGFLRSRRVLSVPTHTVVVPRWVDLRSFPILEPSSFPSDVLHERARTGAGEEFLGVRDYRPGDPPRSVHWRSTARAGHLVVREYEEEVASRVALVLAGTDTGEPPDSAFEALTSAAASIAIYALQTGHPIDIARSGPDGKVEGIADPDRFGLLDWLARAEPIDADLASLAAASIERIGRRGTVVLLSPTTGQAGASVVKAVRLVQSYGSRAIVVAARSSTWGDGKTHISETAFDAITERRVPARVISRGADLARCLSS